MFADHFVNQTNKEAQWAGEHGFGQKNIPGINHKILILEKHATKGSFNNYVDIILPFFEYLSLPLCPFFTLNLDKNRHFLTTFRVKTLHFEVDR